MGRWMCSELRRLLPSLNEYELLPENVTKTVHSLHDVIFISVDESYKHDCASQSALYGSTEHASAVTTAN